MHIVACFRSLGVPFETANYGTQLYVKPRSLMLVYRLKQKWEMCLIMCCELFFRYASTAWGALTFIS